MCPIIYTIYSQVGRSLSKSWNWRRKSDSRNMQCWSVIHHLVH